MVGIPRPILMRSSQLATFRPRPIHRPSFGARCLAGGGVAGWPTPKARGSPS